jgi:ABC-type nitrate/sulfonate/bicarbonate transport system substrate-binding protein
MPTPKIANSSRRKIRLGYVPLVDCAPLVVAQEVGIFERHHLNVRLSRELGWASVRDRIYQGELDAAQSITGIAFALRLGLAGVKRSVVVPLILNLHGNAITLSTKIKSEHVTRTHFKSYLKTHWKKDRPLTLAATHRYSSHHILLLQWLRMHQLSYPEDVDIIFLPPKLMASHLKSGHIDGYCVGEPWNSEAILSNIGWCAATSSELAYHHPEKALLISDRFLEESHDETVRLVSALIEACKLCQDAAFRPQLIDILSLKKNTNASREILSNSLGSVFEGGTRRISCDDFHIFAGSSVNEPSVDKATWTLSHLRNSGVMPDTQGVSLTTVFREDIFHAATA